MILIDGVLVDSERPIYKFCRGCQIDVCNYDFVLSRVYYISKSLIFLTALFYFINIRFHLIDDIVFMLIGSDIFNSIELILIPIISLHYMKKYLVLKIHHRWIYRDTDNDK